MLTQSRLPCLAILVFAVASHSASIADSCPGDAMEDLDVADVRVSLLQESVSVHRVLEAAGQKKGQASKAQDLRDHPDRKEENMLFKKENRTSYRKEENMLSKKGSRDAAAPVALVELAAPAKESLVNPADVVGVPAVQGGDKPGAMHQEVAAERVEVVTNRIPNVIWMVIVVLSWLLIVMCFSYCVSSDKRDLEIREVVREVLVPQVQEVPKPFPVPQIQVIEKIVEVPVLQIQQVAVPQIQVVEKAVPQVQVQHLHRLHTQQVSVPQVQVPVPYVQQASMVSTPQIQQVAVPQVQVENISPVASAGLAFYRPPSPESVSRNIPPGMTADYLASGTFPTQLPLRC